MRELQYRETVLRGINDSGICAAALERAKVEQGEAEEAHRGAQAAFRRSGEKLAAAKNRYAVLNAALKQSAAEYQSLRRAAAEAIVADDPLADAPQRLARLKSEHDQLSDAVECCVTYSMPDAKRAEIVAEMELTRARILHNEAIASVLGIESWLLLAPALAHDPGIALVTGDTAADVHFRAIAILREDLKRLESRLLAHDQAVERDRIGARI
jgi:hypothetical protein